jgi:signal transduction histidine kinase
MIVKILLIDQDPYTLEKLQTNLARAGYTVLVAADGEAGLRLARLEKPNLVVMDILLIGMDGLEVCQRLRQDEATKQIPIFLISSLDVPARNQPWQPTPQSQWQLLRYNAYLPKPVDLNQFVRKVEALLKSDQASTQPTGPTVFLAMSEDEQFYQLKQALLAEDFDVRPFADMATALPAIYAFLPAGLVISQELLTPETWQPIQRFQERNPAFSIVVLQTEPEMLPEEILACVDYVVIQPAEPWQVVLGVERSLRHRNLLTRVKTLSREVLTLNHELLDTKHSLGYQNEELDHINRRMHDLSELKETLTGMLVHDLKAPLAAIMGSMQFLTMDPKNTISENSQRILSGGLAAGQQMLRMTHTLLDEQKLENHQLVFDIEPVELQEPVDISLEMMGPLFNMHKVTVETCYEEDLPPLKADPMVLQRIIENLLDNATKYSPSKEVITIKAHRIGDFVEIAVCDRGEGIPPEQRHLIFDRFTQLQNAHSSKMRHGVGLGLAFCKLAVETMGGKIWVDSPPDNVGTAFLFQLPVYTEED